MIKYTDDELREAVAISESFSGVIRILGAGASGSVHGHIKRRIIDLGVDYSHFTHRNTVADSKKRKDILTLLPEGSRRATRRRLLKAMLDSGLEYVCPCGQGDVWNNQKLVLEIDHIDGNSLNNTIENLRFLCPNCHTQTESNFRSRACGPDDLTGPSVKTRASEFDICQCGNTKRVRSKVCRQCSNSTPRPHREKITWPTDEELDDMVDLLGYTGAGRELGVSDNSIRKRLKRLDK